MLDWTLLAFLKRIITFKWKQTDNKQVCRCDDMTSTTNRTSKTEYSSKLTEIWQGCGLSNEMIEILTSQVIQMLFHNYIVTAAPEYVALHH